MKEPWFREQSGTWVVTLDGGGIKTLGRDEHGATRKKPPKEIQEAWHKLNVEGPVKKQPDITFAEAAESYLESLDGCTAKTLKTSRWQIDQFKSHIGKMRVVDLRADHLRAYLKAKTTWSQSSKATAVSKVVAVLNHAVEAELIDAHFVRFPKKNPRLKKPTIERRRGIVTTDEQAVIEAEARPYLRDFLIGLRESGCRPSELAGALIENLDLKSGTLRVKNKTANQTGEQYRTVWLSDELRALISRLIRGRAEGHIWLNTQGRPHKVEVLACTLRRLRDRKKFRKGITLYGYRHRWGSNAINAGADSVVVARAMGHKDTRMVMMNYYLEDEEAMRRAVQAATKKPT